MIRQKVSKHIITLCREQNTLNIIFKNKQVIFALTRSVAQYLKSCTNMFFFHFMVNLFFFVYVNVIK